MAFNLANFTGASPNFNYTSSVDAIAAMHSPNYYDRANTNRNHPGGGGLAIGDLIHEQAVDGDATVRVVSLDQSSPNTMAVVVVEVV